MENRADVADMVDGAKDSARFRDEKVPDRGLTCLTRESGVSNLPEFRNWSRTPEPTDLLPWAERADLIAVVRDLADENLPPLRISRELGLTVAEVIKILRRTDP
jgi:hypothetical protein